MRRTKSEPNFTSWEWSNMYTKGKSFVEEAVHEDEESLKNDETILSQSLPLQRSQAIKKKKQTDKSILSKELQKELEKKLHKNLITKIELGKPVVISGTKDALLLHMIYQQDETYEKEFFHTYRYLFKPESLLSTLIKQAIDLRSSLKVLNVLLPWFEFVSTDFTHNEDLMKKLVSFVLFNFSAKKRLSTKKKIDPEDIDCIEDLESVSNEFILSILKKKPFVKKSEIILAKSVFSWILESLYIPSKDKQLGIDVCDMAIRTGILLRKNAYDGNVDWTSDTEVRFQLGSFVFIPPPPTPTQLPEVSLLTLKPQDGL